MRNRRRILIVDDEQATRELLSQALSKEYHVRSASSGEDALAALKKQEFDIVLLDLNLPGISGMEVIDGMHEVLDSVPTVIVVTADGNVNSAVEALQGGAYDYLVKPFSIDTLRTALGKVEDRTSQMREVAAGRGNSSRSSRRFAGMIGGSFVMMQMKAEIEKVADTRGTILLTGESGTGKELAARAIHELSFRRNSPYVRLNCAAIPETLLEAELFGHEKGAFTNAIARKEGMFELANGGTLLLDEVTEINTGMQAKLLRVLQEREIMRLGGKVPIKVDVRVIATSNKDLKEEVRSKRFKEDLYYRLNVIPIRTPALREHREDIPHLVEHFVERSCLENGRELMEVSPEAVEVLKKYDWPGNVRELENCLERSVIMSDGNCLDVEHLRLDENEIISGSSVAVDDSNLTLRDMEKELILRRLNLTGGNRTRAAELLGISVRTLRNKINLYRNEGVSIPG